MPLLKDEYVIPDVMLICDRKQIKKKGLLIKDKDGNFT